MTRPLATPAGPPHNRSQKCRSRNGNHGSSSHQDVLQCFIISPMQRLGVFSTALICCVYFRNSLHAISSHPDLFRCENTSRIKTDQIGTQWHTLWKMEKAAEFTCEWNATRLVKINENDRTNTKAQFSLLLFTGHTNVCQKKSNIVHSQGPNQMYTIPAFDKDYRINQVATLGKMPSPFIAWHQITLQEWSKQEKSLSFSTHVDRSFAVWRNDSPNSLCDLLREKEDNTGHAKHSPFLLHSWIKYVQGPLSAGIDVLWSGEK